MLTSEDIFLASGVAKGLNGDFMMSQVKDLRLVRASVELLRYAHLNFLFLWCAPCKSDHQRSVTSQVIFGTKY